MTWNTIATVRSALLATALALPTASLAQTRWTYTDWNGDGNLELSQSEVSTGLQESGTYSAWDRDDEVGLNEGELASGAFSRWDTDDDLQISEDEYGAGSRNWYGSDDSTPFADYDTDTSGFIDTTEFGSAWNNDHYAGWDSDTDGLLTEDEFGTGVFNAADTDSNQVITVEEEGWFEGWFDGDDLEAEIQEVGDVL